MYTLVCTRSFTDHGMKGHTLTLVSVGSTMLDSGGPWRTQLALELSLLMLVAAWLTL